jgi:hypothetical protein
VERRAPNVIVPSIGPAGVALVADGASVVTPPHASHDASASATPSNAALPIAPDLLTRG